MRYDQQSNLMVVFMSVAYLHAQKRKITAETVWRLLPEGFLAFHRVVRAMKYLTDIGAIEWHERAQGRRAGIVKTLHPEKISMKLNPSRSAWERELKEVVNAGLFRWKNGDLLLDAEMFVTDDLIEACKAINPQVTGEWLFKLLEGLSLKKLLADLKEQF